MKQGDNIYISQQKIADQAVLLAYVNIALWHGGWMRNLWLWGSEIQGTTIQKAITLTKHLNSVRTTDILTVQNKNPDGSALNTITQQGNALIQQANLLVPSLNTYITEQQRTLDNCTAQKKQADDRYNQALSVYNSAVIEQATLQAQEASSCMSTTSVAINSAKWVLSSLQIEISKTQQYIWLITTNKSLLIEYGGVLWTEIPAQLVQLKRDLASL